MGDASSNGAVPERLAHAAASWCDAAAALVPTLPVRPETGESPEAHAVATICVELVLPLAAAAGRWTEDQSTSVLGRAEVKIRHLEATERKGGRDLGLRPAAAETRAILEELKVVNRAPKREAGAPGAFYEMSITPEEAEVAERSLRSLADSLRRGARGPSRRAGTDEHRHRDAPAVLAFWSMKAETCTPGVTQRFALRLARRSPRSAVRGALAELLERLRAEPADVAADERHSDLVELCERSLADLAAD